MGDSIKSTVEIKQILQAASVMELPAFIDTYAPDQRTGVRRLVETARKRLEALEKEMERIEGLRVYEEGLSIYLWHRRGGERASCRACGGRGGYSSKGMSHLIYK